MHRRILTFKCVPYFFELHRNGEMPFTLRRFDAGDWRFQALEEDWRQCFIKLRKKETGEWMKRTVKGYEHLPPCMGNWVFIHF